MVPLIATLDGERYGSLGDFMPRDSGALYGQWGEWEHLIPSQWDFTVASNAHTGLKPDEVSLYEKQWTMSEDTKRGENK